MTKPRGASPTRCGGFCWASLFLFGGGCRCGGWRGCRLLQALDDDRDQRNDQEGQDAVEWIVNRPGDLRLQRPRLDLQRVDRAAVDFGGEFELSPARRPAGNQEQDRGNREVDGAENRGGRYRAPYMYQREICRQLEHQ